MIGFKTRHADCHMKFVQIIPRGSKKGLAPGGNMFNIGLYRENMKKSCLEQQGLEP